jgi:drug/metabolite transporter (DMT)-like permease
MPFSVPTDQSAEPRRAILYGILFMCLAVSMFPFLNAGAKYLGARYPISEVVWARYAGHLIFMLIAFLPRHGPRLFQTKRFGMHVVRSVLLFVSTLLYFTALTFIPIPSAAAVSFTGPIIATALSVPLLGEAVGARRWSAVFVGFVGAMIIIRPGLGNTHWATLLVVGSAASYALYQIFTRKIAAGEHADTSITYTAVVGAIVASFGIAFEDWVLPQGWFDLLVFISLGLIGGVGHYLVVRSVALAPMPILSPFGYGQLIGATILGYAWFGEFPDSFTWLGAAIIIASGLYITYRESVRRRDRS